MPLAIDVMDQGTMAVEGDGSKMLDNDHIMLIFDPLHNGTSACDYLFDGHAVNLKRLGFLSMCPINKVSRKQASLFQDPSNSIFEEKTTLVVGSCNNMEKVFQLDL